MKVKYMQKKCLKFENNEVGADKKIKLHLHQACIMESYNILNYFTCVLSVFKSFILLFYLLRPDALQLKGFFHLTIKKQTFTSSHDGSRCTLHISSLVITILNP